MAENPSTEKKRNHEDAATQARELADALQAYHTWKAQDATLLPASSPASAPAFDVAFWNIQRIPFAKVMNPQYHHDRLNSIMALLGEFDAAGISERILPAPRPPHPYSVNDNAREHLHWQPIPHFRNHGLNISATMPLTHTHEDHYSVCSAKGADCFVDKGFIITRMETPNGPVTVATTHLDSNNSPKDKTARRVQLAELSNALDAHQGERLLVIGDFNCDANDREDNAMLHAFLTKHGLQLDARESGSGDDLLASRGLTLVSTMEYNNSHWTDHHLEAARYRIPVAPARQIASVGER